MSYKTTTINNQTSLVTANPLATLPRDRQPDTDPSTRTMTKRTDTTRRRLPEYMDPTNQFGELTYLQLIGKDNAPLPRDPFLIGESVEEAAGGQIEDAVTEAQGTRYTLKVRNPSQVEKLMKMTNLKDGTEVVVEAHPNLNVSRCVITCFDLIHMDDTEILKRLIGQGVIRTVRIKRNVNQVKVNTPALILTFAKATFPEYVKIGLLRVKTRPYYPNPLICYGCFRYGHPRARCPGPQRCFNCSAEHQDAECPNSPSCSNCNGNHRPTNRQCPIYKFEQEVVRIKINENTAYTEARKRAEERKVGSYAQAAAKQTNEQANIKILEQKVKEQDEQIKKLMELAKVKDEQLEQLRSQLKNIIDAAKPQQTQEKGTSSIVQNNIEPPMIRSRDGTPTETVKKRRGRPKRTVTPKISTEPVEICSPPRKKTTVDDCSDDDDIEITEAPPN